MGAALQFLYGSTLAVRGVLSASQLELPVRGIDYAKSEYPYPAEGV